MYVDMDMYVDMYIFTWVVLRPNKK